MWKAFCTAEKVPAAVVSLLLLLFTAACTSGSSGKDVDDSTGVGLGTYKFTVNLDIGSADPIPLRIEADAGDGSKPLLTFVGVARPLGDEFIGRLELAEENGQLFIPSVTVDSTTIFKVDVSDLWTGIILTVEVTDDIVFENGDDPSSGSFTLNNGTDSISVTFSKKEGEYIVNFSGGADAAGLDDFKDYLENSTVSDLLKQASVAYHMIEILYDQVNFIAGIIVKIEGEESGTETGDAHPGLPDPAGGTFTLNFISGNAEQGADFSLVFDNYWKDDPDEDIDTLIDGTVNLVNLFITETDDVLTQIGFAWGENAGIFFDQSGISIYETEDSESGLTQKLTHTIYGSYGIMFFKQ